MTDAIAPWDWTNSIYKKNKIHEEWEDWFAIWINKILAQDKNNLPILKKLVYFQYYVKPTHYYYLLYFNIKSNSYPPRLNFKKKKEEKEDKDKKEITEKIKYILRWSDKEVYYNRFIVNDLLKDKEYWKKELGIT